MSTTDRPESGSAVQVSASPAVPDSAQLPPQGPPGTRAATPVAAPPRPGPADPVRLLMHRHRELCETAVDPWEIAAGLEAHGVTDRTAARYRHRDVFSLAEEVWARAPGSVPPRTSEPTGPAPAPAPGNRPARGVRFALHLLPAALCATTAAAFAAADPAQGGPLLRPAVLVAGAGFAWPAVRLAVRSGPLRARHRAGPAAAVTTALLLVWTLLAAHPGTGGPPAGRPASASVTTAAAATCTATAVGLACGLPLAAWWARWFARRGRRALADSRWLTEFTGRTRPALLLTAAGHAVSLAAVLAAARTAFGLSPVPDGAALALGVLLFQARLSALYGRTRAQAGALLTALAGHAALAAGHLLARPHPFPGAGWFTDPAREWQLRAVVCAASASVLLLHGRRTLTRASAHLPGAVPQESVEAVTPLHAAAEGAGPAAHAALQRPAAAAPAGCEAAPPP
ncbi:hypothetical protein ACFV3R_13400 [Streptomyces sp. NPDC059740]|uniref:hypothetical protein n=1 Tax=Streptomyces sp. NPDC059740 TaxID=3346926 RepID=UPI0036568E92